MFLVCSTARLHRPDPSSLAFILATRTSNTSLANEFGFNLRRLRALRDASLPLYGVRFKPGLAFGLSSILDKSLSERARLQHFDPAPT